MREKRVALKDGINVAMFCRYVGDILVVEFDMAHINAFKPGYQAKHGGFAAAGWAKQGEEFAVIDGQVKVRNDRFTIKTFTKVDQLHQRSGRTRLCIQFFTLSLVNASDNTPDAGFVINHLRV